MQPSPYDVLLGSLMEDAVGERAKKKVAKRRLDMIAGNAANYSRSLNNPKQLEQVEEYTELIASLSLLQAEKDAEKLLLAATKRQGEAEKARK